VRCGFGLVVVLHNASGKVQIPGVGGVGRDERLFRPCIAFMLTQQITGGVPAQSESTIKKARQRRLCGVKFELESVITA